MKCYRRWTPNGSEFFVDESGNVVSSAQAKGAGIVESASGLTDLIVESDAETAAAKTMVGHFVRDNSGAGYPDVYKVASVDDDQATLQGPIGKGGTKTVSHSNLVKNHTDLGDSASLDQVQESARLLQESARLQRRTKLGIANGLTVQEATIAAEGRGVPHSFARR